MGAPVSIHDADVTVTLPHPGDLSQGYEALAMHVKLSRVITSVLNCEKFLLYIAILACC
jgi:proline utilization trans-activator